MAEFNQQIIVPNTFANAKKEFTSNVMTSFEKKVVAWPMVMQQTRTGLKQSVQINVGRAGAAVYHEPGTDLPDAAARATQDVVQFFEDRPTLWNAKTTDVEMLTDHTDFSQRLVIDASNELARLSDVETLKALAIGAAEATTASFDGGFACETAGLTLAAAFPKTPAGALLIEHCLDDIAQNYQDKNIDTEEDDLFAFLPPLLINVLGQNRDYFDRDFNGPEIANLSNKKLLRVSKFWILSSNNIPTSDSSSATQPTFNSVVQYGQDNTLLAGLTMKMGALSAWKSPMETWSEFDTNHQIKNIGAKFFKGITVERSEFTAALTISGA